MATPCYTKLNDKDLYSSSEVTMASPCRCGSIAVMRIKTTRPSLYTDHNALNELASASNIYFMSIMATDSLMSQCRKIALPYSTFEF